MGGNLPAMLEKAKNCCVVVMFEEWENDSKTKVGVSPMKIPGGRKGGEGKWQVEGGCDDRVTWRRQQGFLLLSVGAGGI